MCSVDTARAVVSQVNQTTIADTLQHYFVAFRTSMGNWNNTNLRLFRLSQGFLNNEKLGVP